MSKPQIIVGVSKENLRPEIPPACPPEFAKLMQYTIRAGLVVVKANSDNHGRDCWEQDPECRPRFSEILKRLEAMQPPLPISAAPSINITISPQSMTERFKAVTAVSSSPSPTHLLVHRQQGSTALPLPSGARYNVAQLGD